MARASVGRDRQRRRDAALPGHGHRHGETSGRRAARDPPPPARHARCDRRGQRRRLPVGRAGRHRGNPGARVRARFSWEDPASTCRRSSTTTRFPGQMRWCGPRSKPNWNRSARRRCTSDYAGSTRQRPYAIGPFNARRIIRALEVISITGEPFGARLPDETQGRHADAGGRPSGAACRTRAATGCPGRPACGRRVCSTRSTAC